MKVGKHLLAAAVAMSALFVAGAAQAVTPANTSITNTASLTYTGLSTPITASVDVTVDLTPAAPTLVAPSANTVAEGQSSTATLTITSNANGPDIYNLSSGNALTNLTGVPAPSVSFDQSGAITSVTLGATAAAVAAGSGATSITVPADGVANSEVNGIQSGDTVVIGANAYTVSSVTDNATGTSTITLGSALTTAVSLGDLISERQQFDMIIDTVTNLTVSGSPANIVVTTTATSNTDGAFAGAIPHTTNVVEILFEKFVRNVSDPNGSGAATSIGGNSYYPTAGAVVAETGETLEYALRVTTPAGSGVNGAAVTDAVPAFTTYAANSTRLNTITVNGDGATSPLVAGLAIDDNGSRGAGAVASGSIAASSSAVVIFQVTVD